MLPIGRGALRCSTVQPSGDVPDKQAGIDPPTATVAGPVRTCTNVASLADTNVLVYRFDWRFPDKQRIADQVLRSGISDASLYISHQAVVEFVAAVSRPRGNAPPLLGLTEARREAEELLTQFDVLYPDEELVRIALRGAAAYQLSWFDAHMWAYAERYSLAELISEEFEDGRLYGTVQAINPFATAQPSTG